jgi:uncharacterized membrane protein YtjA (UPF0391 family)
MALPYWYLLMALVAAGLGYSGLTDMGEIARLLFYVFLSLFVIAFGIETLRDKTPEG